MSRQSAGILLYRRGGQHLEVLLVHPGGPFWRNKDKSAWSIPKGEFETGEDPLAAAQREVREETGLDLDGAFLVLNPRKQPNG
jgi:predicted NUDIX family NTP pyrophosphohydrolase